MIRKEFRALLPAWIACAVAILGSALSGTWLEELALPAYFIGAAAIGALAFGHEYTCRTLPMLLAQPVSRGRIFLTKMVVLAALLIGLRALATVAPLARISPELVTPLLWLPLIGGLMLTPWLTLVTRAPIAGAVFTLALPGAALVVGEWAGVRRYGSGFTSEVNAFRTAFLWWTMLGLSGIGAVMAWRTFNQLQIIEGGGAHVHVIGAITRGAEASRAPSPRHPILRLIAKELHLQQLSLVVAGLYVAGYLAKAAFSGTLRTLDGEMFGLTIFYAGLLAVMIGSLASAEERHLGTLQWQTLLPMSSMKQWTIKVAFAVALALLLGVVVPSILAYFMPPARWGPGGDDWLYFNRPMLGTLVLLVCASMYISSLAPSGVWALVGSFAAFFGVVSLANLVRWSVIRALPDDYFRRMWHVARYEADIAFIVLIGALLVLALRFALLNHRSDERGWRHAVPQLAVLIGGVAAVVAAGALLGA